jgi:hypothetical protein
MLHHCELLPIPATPPGASLQPPCVDDHAGDRPTAEPARRRHDRHLLGRLHPRHRATPILTEATATASAVTMPQRHPQLHAAAASRLHHRTLPPRRTITGPAWLRRCRPTCPQRRRLGHLPRHVFRSTRQSATKVTSQRNRNATIHSHHLPPDQEQQQHLTFFGNLSFSTAGENRGLAMPFVRPH